MPVNNNIILQAKWESEAVAEYWQVSWELNGGSWPSGDNHAIQVVKGGTLAEPTAPTKAGKVFDGWYKEAALTNKINFPYNVSAVTANFTLYAKWSDPATEYWQITWELDGGAWPSIGDNHVDKVEKGSKLSEPVAPTKSGNTFDGRYGEAALKNKISFPCDITSDFKLYAKWSTISSTPDVYTAGYYYANGKYIACYWKNAERHDLTDGTTHAQAFDITVVGDIVYTAGFYSNSMPPSNYEIPCYWINDQRYDLCTLPDHGRARAIKVYDGKVYTAGNCDISDNDKNACYWVNQERHDIYTIRSGATARDIALIDNIVYTCGTYHNGYNTIACFWVGSAKYNLQGSGYNSYAYSMYYTGSEFYIAGSHSSGKSGYFTADLNGNSSYGNLNANQTGGSSSAKDICFYNNTIYAVGYRSSGSTQHALFWKNNAMEQMATDGSNAESICISDDVIYIAGKNGNGEACYWERKINSTSFSPTILSGNGSPTAIFVK